MGSLSEAILINEDLLKGHAKGKMLSLLGAHVNATDEMLLEIQPQRFDLKEKESCLHKGK